LVTYYIKQSRLDEAGGEGDKSAFMKKKWRGHTSGRKKSPLQLGGEQGEASGQKKKRPLEDLKVKGSLWGSNLE